MDKNPENVKSDDTVKAEEKPKTSVFSRLAFGLFTLFVAAAAGFGGGYLANNDQSGSNRGAVEQAVDSEGNLITEIAKEVGQSVVSVNVVSNVSRQSFFGPVESRQQSAGTGFILNSDGIIITNRHVIPRGNANISVTLSDGTELEDVSVIGRTNDGDPLDIAFLKINDKKGKTLKPVKIGDSSKVPVGERVVAIGNALGQFQNTVTAGIISGYGRSVQAQGENGVDTLQNLFQTDASINQGNSGGPLVNMAGEVIGINVAAAAGAAENIGFAIPISDAKGSIDSILQKGRLERPYLGVRYVTLTDDIAFRLNLDTKRGAYIPPAEDGQRSILPETPAAQAGIKEKDIITKINDIEIDEKNSLSSVLGRYSAGETVKVTIVRDGKTETLDVTLGAAPSDLD